MDEAPRTTPVEAPGGSARTVPVTARRSGLSGPRPDPSAFAKRASAVAGQPQRLGQPRSAKRRYVRSSYCVWELTLRCNLRCRHCGSRAGAARTGELSTEEALAVVRQLAEHGIGEVTMSGGEVFLRPDWTEIASAIRAAGMMCTLITGGYKVSRRTAERMREAGIAAASVSVDGLAANHDFTRGREGSWRSCFETMGHFRQVGLPFGCNTQLNRLTLPELPEVYERIRDAGARAWQVQMTVPMGNAADHAEALFQPCEMLEVYPVLARVIHRANREGVDVQPGNCIGYFGPYEEILRHHAYRDGQIWMGCQAGLCSLGIEADGKVKGCLSLQTASYAAGNIRETPLGELLEREQLTFNAVGGTQRARDELWGYCAECELADLCRAGCAWTSHAFFERRGNNPYCHRRALALAERGLRERVRLVKAAPGTSFDNALFEMVTEPLDAPWPEGDPLRFTADRIAWPDGWERWPDPLGLR